MTPRTELDPGTITAYADSAWASHIDTTLREYIRIPNVSVAFDPDWDEAGHMARAAELLRQWCEARAAEVLTDATVELHEIPGRTPVLLVDVPAFGPAARDSDDVVLLYGHLDKQPPFEGWRDGLGPWEPVIDRDRLYGRGAADDGYAVFAALTAIESVRAAGGSHARCVVLIEASEESGSPDLPAHLDRLESRIGVPSLVIGLDSGCGDWQRLWVTTSLRGLVDLVLRVEILSEGVHSGKAGGVVPSSFRILRNLLDRLEDPATGELSVPELRVDIPHERREQAQTTAAELGRIADEYPFVHGARPVRDANDELLLARSWQPALEVVGLEGAPTTSAAGNVLRPFTSAKVSIRLPPTADPYAVMDAVVQRLTEDPPYGARVTVTRGVAEAGWHAPAEPPWLPAALHDASRAAFGRPPSYMGEGGTIPFMGMLGRSFPDAQFVITGVLGPNTNAHGPNEFLHLPTARRVTAAVAHVLDAHARRSAPAT
jgi:acetylornithine deacetylase/succinyl-diaminopimelate desuccinylase-like protein